VTPGENKLVALLGVATILAAAYAISNNRKAINYRLVVTGLALQVGLAVFVLKVEFGQILFRSIGEFVSALVHFSDQGAGFVFGPLVSNPEAMLKMLGPGADYIFAFRLVPTIIFVASLVSVGYYMGIMQRLVQLVARTVAFVMGASGSEALSNAASIFVGQIEAQILIKPYVPSMTMSELLASMAGSLACISGSVLAVYVAMGMKASYLLAASVMAAPGALVISKIVYPETEESQTKGTVKIEIKPQSVNLLDAAASGASDGLRVGLNVIAMLIGFISLIALTDGVLAFIGHQIYSAGLASNVFGLDLNSLRLKDLFGIIFAPIAWLLGVPWQDANVVGRLMGEKFVINEFVAYTDLSALLKSTTPQLSHQAEVIATFALCGFANFGSVAMQIGGIGELAPNRRHDLARLGIKALLCGTLASYMSAALAGLLT
jgi:concentrative nucleoside transporter, CNT family